MEIGEATFSYHVCVCVCAVCSVCVCVCVNVIMFPPSFLFVTETLRCVFRFRRDSWSCFQRKNLSKNLSTKEIDGPGVVYKGMWKNGQRHGHGVLMERNSDECYTGAFNDGKKHCMATVTFVSAVTSGVLYKFQYYSFHISFVLCDCQLRQY